jgi:hypothetical protein
MNAAEQIETLYATSFTGSFPYADCYRLSEELPASQESLIPALDWYFGAVAGYSSSASGLHARPAAALQAAETVLSKSFFERFPELESYKPLIDEERTPDLHQRLQVVEKLRLGLLDLVHQACLERV